MNHVIEIGRFPLHNPEPVLEKLARKVKSKLGEVRRSHPGNKEKYEALQGELASLGVTPQNTYLYIQGHHIFDSVVAPVVARVCEKLRLERENEIRQKACHHIQRQNELSAYTHSVTDSAQMLKKNTGYMRSAPFKRLIADLDKLFATDEEAT